MTTGPSREQESNRPATGEAVRAEVTQDIERTRQQLGETVEALAAKADVRRLARHKAGQAREQAAERIGHARAAVRQALPQQVRRATRQAADGARRQPAALAAAVITALLACVAILRRRHR